jgi:hypothetical protein
VLVFRWKRRLQTELTELNLTEGSICKWNISFVTTQTKLIYHVLIYFSISFSINWCHFLHLFLSHTRSFTHHSILSLLTNFFSHYYSTFLFRLVCYFHNNPFFSQSSLYMSHVHAYQLSLEFIPVLCISWMMHVHVMLIWSLI